MLLDTWTEITAGGGPEASILKYIHYFFVTQYHFIPDLDSRGTAKLMHGETHKNPKAYMLEDTRILA